MLLLYPPLAKPSEPPAGIAQLAGTLKAHGYSCQVLDCNIEGILSLLSAPHVEEDTWSKRALNNREDNLKALRNLELYSNTDRYRKAVNEINRLLENRGKHRDVALNLANYQDGRLSPLNSRDLRYAAHTHEDNIFFPYFSKRLTQLLDTSAITHIGVSLNYLSQALTTFAIIGFLKKHAPALVIILGGGLITSWRNNLKLDYCLEGLVDQLISGPGEIPLLNLVDKDYLHTAPPDYSGFPTGDYLSPGTILPFSTSTGCYWNKCSFCPEKAENNPYSSSPPEEVLKTLRVLIEDQRPSLIHFLDNALSPAMLRALALNPVNIPWYGFTRISKCLTDREFCKKLKESGCTMLKLGIESGDQTVLDAMNKGIDLREVSLALQALMNAGISTYVYLLFGTPTESLAEARNTLSFVVEHHRAITFLNLAIFNMPTCSEEAKTLEVDSFYKADLSLYTDFTHPRDWSRSNIRKFLDQEFKRHPKISSILRRDPPFFTSNHAPFFTANSK